MKVFDTDQAKDWIGSGFSIDEGIFKIKSNLNAGQHIWFEPGKHDIGIISKKITGNGSFTITISDEDDTIVLEEKIRSSGGGWSSFNSSFNADGGIYFINIYRESSDFGTIQIGKIFIKACFVSHGKKRAIRKNKASGRSISVKRAVKIAVIVPYGIFGGAEVYLREYIKKISNIKNIRVVFLYMKENPLSKYLSIDGVFHKTILSENHLKMNLESNSYDSIIFYNSFRVYEIICELKDNCKINSNIVEIYHSDFQWSGSISSHKSRKFVDRVIRISESLYNDVSGVDSDKIITIPTGIDLDRFKNRNKKIVRKKLGIEGDAVVIGTISRLSREKNIEYFLSLSRYVENALFLIVGDGPDKQRLLEMSKYIPGKTRFVGNVENPEHYYNCLDAFVLSSKIEGISISAMEAMASEVPVFCTNVGSMSEIVKDGKTGFFLTGDLSHDSNLISKNLKIGHILHESKALIEEKFNLDKNFNKFISSILFFGKYYIDNKNNLEKLPGEYI